MPVQSLTQIVTKNYMILQILLFGITTDLLEASSIDINLPENSTVADLKLALTTTYPKLKKLTAYAVAVNETYASNEVLLKANDVVAIIPPVSGG